MTDTATRSLEHITGSGEYVPVPGVPVFDVHDEFDAKGNLVRRFGQRELQELAEHCNDRERTGDLSPFGPGHTVDGAPEESQPPVWGYARNFRVARFGPGQKLGLVADFYVRRQLRTADGRMVDGEAYMKEFPRRSIELWAKDKIIDWIALLRRTPQRDLGLLAYSKVSLEKQAPWDMGDKLYPDAKRSRPLAAALSATGKLRYAMEDSMPDPTTPPDANTPAPDPDELTPDEQKSADRNMKHYRKKDPLIRYMCSKYGPEAGLPPESPDPQGPERNAAFPGPTNAAVPAPDAPDSKYQYPAGKNKGDDPHGDYKDDNARKGQPDRYAAENARLKAELERERRLVRYERDLRELAADGYDLDLGEELRDCQDMSQDQFNRHRTRIINRYQKAPTGSAPLRLGNPEARSDLSNARLEEAIKYMRQKGETDFNKALKATE